MNLHERYGLRHIINARGTFTPLGVSRTPEPVIEATAEALRHFFDMAELQRVAGGRIAELTGAEAACVTNCVAAGITVAVAAAMAGADAARIAQLPDPAGMNRCVVVQAGHLVNFGQPVEQAVRLSGAEVLTAGDADGCLPEILDARLAEDGVAALLIVDSRLSWGDNVSAAEAVALAHARGLPVILDGAAQDLRLPALLATGADAVLVSGQKYLSSPTAGIVLGRTDFVAAILAQEKGIGRAMKAGKEDIIGALAAVEYRQTLDLDAWSAERRAEAEEFAAALGTLAGVSTRLVADPTHGPFWRVHADFDDARCGRPAGDIAHELAAGDPPIYVFEADAAQGTLNFELLSLGADERRTIVDRISEIVGYEKD